MRALFVIAPLLWLLGAVSLWADARHSVLVEVLKLPEAAQILSDEGIAQSEDLNTDMLNGQGGAGWQQQVARIYDPARMVEMVRADLEQVLDGDLLEEVIVFYASDLGEKIITLENTARIAIQDPDVEEAARARYRDLAEETDTPRLDAIGRYIASGDMITRNVESAVNSNFQFLRGLADGDAIEMSEEEMLRDAARDLEDSIEDTTEWLNGYLLLAYSPLSDSELDRYLEFSESAAGKALNRGLFAGFGKAYEDISYALGRAVALNMLAEEL